MKSDNFIDVLPFYSGYGAEIVFEVTNKSDNQPVDYLDDFTARAQIRTDWLAEGGELVADIVSEEPNPNGDQIFFDFDAGFVTVSIKRATGKLILPETDYFLEVQLIDKATSEPNLLAQCKFEVFPTVID